MTRKITVMGSGYVGLVAGTCLAELGNQVLVYEIDSNKVESLKQGEIPIYEPGLEKIFKPLIESGRLKFTDKTEGFLTDRDLVIIAVGTPKREDGSCDISYVLDAARMIGENLTGDLVVVNKSTVPVGTGELVEQKIVDVIKQRSDISASVSVVSNPEFLREGNAVKDFLQPDRVVIGSENSAARETVGELYSSLDCPILYSGLRTAEMIKYASNAFLATKISFINEISNVCEMVGADVTEVACGMGLDHRIQQDFLGAGVGYGGSCFPKDTEALVDIAGQGGYHSQILNAVISVNHQQRIRFARKIVNHLPETEQRPEVAVLGVAFKPETDDMREAPSIEIIHHLQKEGVNVRAYDPEALDNAREIITGVNWALSAEQAVEGADALVILTEWDEFLKRDFARVKQLLNHPVLFDGRNCLPMQQLIDQGYEYYGVGRGIDRLDNILHHSYLLQ